VSVRWGGEGNRYFLHEQRQQRTLATQVRGMAEPVQCCHCQGVYDLATVTRVTVTARYADCSVWQAPCCQFTVDDRGETGWKSIPDYRRIMWMDDNLDSTTETKGDR
jgi:hypothetical protein